MRAAVVALAALAAGCPSNLEEQSHVSKLRVLAVRSDPAELVLTADGGVGDCYLRHYGSGRRLCTS